MTKSDWKPELDSVSDVIAADTWEYRDGNQTRQVVIEIGRPCKLDPKKTRSSWYCALRIDGEHEGVRPIMGAGPVDALMNAMAVVRKVFDRIHEKDWS